MLQNLLTKGIRGLSKDVKTVYSSVDGWSIEVLPHERFVVMNISFDGTYICKWDVVIGRLDIVESQMNKAIISKLIKAIQRLDMEIMSIFYEGENLVNKFIK